MRTLNKQERIAFELQEREQEILMLKSAIRAYDFYLQSLGIPNAFKPAWFKPN
jgi:hypothetical protein